LLYIDMRSEKSLDFFDAFGKIRFGLKRFSQGRKLLAYGGSASNVQPCCGLSLG